MWEFLKKKKVALPGNPKGNDEDEESVEAPEVDSTLSDIDAALKQADQLRAKKEQEEFEKAEREAAKNSGSRCGCW